MFCFAVEAERNMAGTSLERGEGIRPSQASESEIEIAAGQAIVRGEAHSLEALRSVSTMRLCKSVPREYPDIVGARPTNPLVRDFDDRSSQRPFNYQTLTWPHLVTGSNARNHCSVRVVAFILRSQDLPP